MYSQNAYQPYCPPRAHKRSPHTAPKRLSAIPQSESLAEPAPLFRKIKDAATVLGISQYYLRQLVRENTVPFIRSGATYYVDIESARGVLRTMAEANMTMAAGGEADALHQ